MLEIEVWFIGKVGWNSVRYCNKSWRDRAPFEVNLGAQAPSQAHVVDTVDYFAHTRFSLESNTERSCSDHWDERAHQGDIRWV